MALSIELPAPLEEELALEAKREGVTVSDQAALLLQFMTALAREGRITPFRSLVQAYLRQKSLDAERLADVIDGLVAICLHSESLNPANSNVSTLNDPSKNSKLEAAKSLLREWRSPDVHREIGIESSMEIMQVEFPPLESLIQRAGRMTRESILGKYAYLGGGTEEFMRQKQTEIDRENRR
jgi:hypothetical protein